MTLSEGPGGVVVAAEVVVGTTEVGAVEGAAVFGALVLVVVFRLVGGAVHVVGALVVVVNGGAGAVLGLAVGALGGAGGAGAGVDALVAGAGCSFCGDFFISPPTRTTVATMTVNAATMAAPIIVRPPSVLNHCVVPGFGSVSVVS
jgi:hypothetical protein